MRPVKGGSTTAPPPFPRTPQKAVCTYNYTISAKIIKSCELQSARTATTHSPGAAHACATHTAAPSVSNKHWLLHTYTSAHRQYYAHNRSDRYAANHLRNREHNLPPAKGPPHLSSLRHTAGCTALHCTERRGNPQEGAGKDVHVPHRPNISMGTLIVGTDVGG